MLANAFTTAKLSPKRIQLSSGATEAGRPAPSSGLPIKLSHFSLTACLLHDRKAGDNPNPNTSCAWDPNTAISQVDLSVRTEGQLPSEIRLSFLAPPSPPQKKKHTKKQISWERNSPGHFIKVHSS